MTEISIFKTVLNTRLPKVPLVRRAGLSIDICDLSFVIQTDKFWCLISKIADFMDKHYFESDFDKHIKRQLSEMTDDKI